MILNIVFQNFKRFVVLTQNILLAFNAEGKYKRCLTIRIWNVGSGWKNGRSIFHESLALKNLFSLLCPSYDPIGNYAEQACYAQHQNLSWKYVCFNMIFDVIQIEHEWQLVLELECLPLNPFNKLQILC